VGEGVGVGVRVRIRLGLFVASDTLPVTGFVSAARTRVEATNDDEFVFSTKAQFGDAHDEADATLVC